MPKEENSKRMNTAIEDEQKSIVICYLTWVTIKQDENITIHIQLRGKNSGPEQSQDIYKLFKPQYHEAISKVKLNLAKCECPN